MRGVRVFRKAGRTSSVIESVDSEHPVGGGGDELRSAVIVQVGSRQKSIGSAIEPMFLRRRSLAIEEHELSPLRRDHPRDGAVGVVKDRHRFTTGIAGSRKAGHTMRLAPFDNVI